MKLAPEGSDKGVYTAAGAAGMTLSAFLKEAGVEGTGIKYTALVNNSRKSSDYVLCDCDSLTVMPLLAGG